MSEYDNTNSGAIFVNDKGDNEKRPDRKGSLNVEGVDYWISGWVREKDGKPYMSIKVERKDKQQATTKNDQTGKAVLTSRALITGFLDGLGKRMGNHT